MAAVSKGLSKAWHALNQHLPETVDLGEGTSTSGWSRTESPVQIRLVCSHDESVAAVEAKLRVEPAEVATRIKIELTIDRTAEYYQDHKVGNTILGPAPEVKLPREALIEPYRIPILLDLATIQAVHISISAETKDNYWANIARYSFYFGSEARKAHLLWEPISVMQDRNGDIASTFGDRASVLKLGNKKIVKGLKWVLGAPPGAGLGPKAAPDRRHGQAPGWARGGQPLPPSYNRQPSIWSERSVGESSETH
ncbi:hypothetical protein OC846_003520 [Tilletia horrida]|uniref:Uncharacterized protein n=1 Tax=Tilletia horrida TaxID=155126 RepID=A0AAN6GRV7_9BASI|nr:hypothetical protein OC845_003996 [Tilletia horrida]KAK0550859.1 hypothetical protein OC846_003520 [Tilletia horrida]KAK0564955.1 hypothetical protein OC861_003999 [Tilletia horrida]